jgi:hypothetical protein
MTHSRKHNIDFFSKFFSLFHFTGIDKLRFAEENRQQLVNANAIPVLTSLLNSDDQDVQYYCTTALSNIAVDGKEASCAKSP